jgi:CheY-like chemotaxis protein
MTKIMLVEDDNNLREIYQARLAAEGYEIVAAEDGEAALAIAAKEHPALIVTDVMMPKISGFEMLDILRNTDALRDVKVIMLTALSQAEDNARAGKLGADRYLVKSQVTLEDIVKAAHDLLDGGGASSKVAAGPAAPSADQPAGQTAAAATAALDTTPDPGPTTDDAAAPDASAKSDDDQDTADSTSTDTPDTTEAEAEVAEAETSQQEESTLQNQINQFLTESDSEPSAETPLETPAPSVSEGSNESPEPSPSEPDSDVEEPESHEGATDIDLESNIGGQNLVSSAPADETDDEYAKDDSVPDMGNLAVPKVSETPEETPQPNPPTAPEPAPQPEAAPEPAPEPTPKPAPVIDLPAPVMLEQTATAPAPAPIDNPPQSNVEPTGDQVVSSAIDTMMAQALKKDNAQALPPSEAWEHKEGQHASVSSVPIMGAPEGEPQLDPADMPAMTPKPIAPADDAPDPEASSTAAQTTRTPKKIIEPLTLANKPDIHKLLSLEEAKSGAMQAAETVKASSSPVPAPLPPTIPTPTLDAPSRQSMPTPPSPEPPKDDSGLDPNAVAL